MKFYLFIITTILMLISCNENVSFNSDLESEQLSSTMKSSTLTTDYTEKFNQTDSIKSIELYNQLSSDSILIETIFLFQEFLQNDSYSIEDEYLLESKIDSLSKLVNTNIFSNYSNEQSFIALTMLVENNIDETQGIVIFSGNDNCCANALDSYHRCRNDAYRHFAVFTTGVIVLGSVGLILVGATAGSSTVVMAGTTKVLTAAALAETASGLNLLAALEVCSYNYDLDVLDCTCQCDWSASPCGD